MTLDPERELEILGELLAQTTTDAEHLLPLLLAVQRRIGYVSTGAIRAIAQAFNVSRADVYGVVTFYGDLREAPVGEHVVQVCMAEACQAVGCRELAQHAERRLGVSVGASTSDGQVHLEAAYCFGNCALGPSVRIGDRVYGGVTAERFDTLLESLTAGVPSDAPSDVAAAASVITLSEDGSATRVYVPRDTGACAVGADDVAAAITSYAREHALNIRLVRNGSRGAYFMEPLVEIETPSGRIGFANVSAEQIPQLFSGPSLPDATHALSVGLVNEIPWLRDQHRLTFARAGVIDPLSLDEYRASGGMAGLARALTLSSQEIIDELKSSGLRGRGGAAFPAWIKWQTVHDAEGETKYVVCNADEGDSGTFADRLLIEADPLQLIEGMTIAGLAVGASRGFIYLRSEYPLAEHVMQHALRVARAAGVLGASVLGSEKPFDITLRMGGGAYICGEETAMLESLEGKRGVVRAKPPIPALSGLFGKPTVIHNVLSLAAVSDILAKGGDHYAGFGADRSKGTMPFQLGGNLNRGGIVEVPFGITVREMINTFGGGSYSGRPLKAVQIGGPLGAYLPDAQWDTPLAYEPMAAIGAMLGHGGIVGFDDTIDMGAQAEFAMAFCAHESCGKCTPCRIGSTRAVEVIGRIRRGEDTRKQWQLLDELCETMELGSLCALGGLTPMPVRSIMKHFAGDLMGHVGGDASRSVSAETEVVLT